MNAVEIRGNFRVLNRNFCAAIIQLFYSEFACNTLSVYIPTCMYIPTRVHYSDLCYIYSLYSEVCVLIYFWALQYSAQFFPVNKS